MGDDVSDAEDLGRATGGPIKKAPIYGFVRPDGDCDLSIDLPTKGRILDGFIAVPKPKYEALTSERDRLRAQVQAIRELHQPRETRPARFDQPAQVRCGHCADMCHSYTGLNCEYPYDAAWPCSTIQALGEEAK